jgi:hypothetical protein
MINQRPGLRGRRESRDGPFQYLPALETGHSWQGCSFPAAVSPFHSEAMTLESQSGRATGRDSQTKLSQPTLPGQQLSLSLPTPQAGRQATDGLWLLQLERPTPGYTQETRPSPPSVKEKMASLLLGWAKEMCSAGTQVWEMLRTGYPK